MPLNAVFVCREASRLAALRHDRPLVLGERLALGVHLVLCRYCRRYARQLADLDRITRQAGEGLWTTPLPTGYAAAAKARIRERLARRPDPEDRQEPPASTSG